MKRRKMNIFLVAFLLSVGGIANSAELSFYDDFERDEIGSNWTTGSCTGSANTITIVGGMIQSTDNCN
jgi:hypothetical protein